VLSERCRIHFAASSSTGRHGHGEWARNGRPVTVCRDTARFARLLSQVKNPQRIGDDGCYIWDVIGGGRMRVLISADMEGTTGVTGWNDVQPGQAQYERFRRLLTADVNAAVEGAFQGGATEVLVNEAHDGMRNILIEDLDERVEMISGLHKPLVMMEGV